MTHLWNHRLWDSRRGVGSRPRHVTKRVATSPPALLAVQSGRVYERALEPITQSSFALTRVLNLSYQESHESLRRRRETVA